MEKQCKKTVHAILVGLICTLISGIFVNFYITGEFPVIRFSIEPVLGMIYSGFPLPWFGQVVPKAPKEFISQNFVIDLLFWSSAAYCIITALYRIEKRPRKPKKIKKKK